MQTRTFLFADLREYTRFVEHHGDAAAATLIGDYRRLVRAEVARAGGAEVKTEGDSFYVVFDSATAALGCGMAILREAERYSLERADRPLRVGVGIHAGEPRSHEEQFVGEAVIVAARLAQQARAGELLITEVARGLLSRGAVPAATERAGLVLKGIESPPRVYAIEWRAPERAERLAPAAPASVPGRPLEGGIVAARELIGRATELAALDVLLADADRGSGRLVLVAGEAGLGKTALVRHFLAASGGARALIGECTEVGAGRPFGPLVDALLADGSPLPRELDALGPGAQSVIEADRYAVHSAFIRALRERGADHGVVIVLEDIHWADPSTLEFLQHLPRQISAARILALATYRPEEAGASSLALTLARIERSRLASHIRLHPLDEDGTARLVMSALGLERAPTSEFRAAIHERCEGNPFFTEEVLRTLVERGEIRYENGRWLRDRAIRDIELPRTISAAVEQRLRELFPATVRVVQVAAVIGSRFDFDLLAEVGGFAEGALLAALRDTVDAQLVIEDRERGAEAYRFRHALTREVVLAGILGRERRQLHLAVAHAIKRRAGAETSRHAEDLAYHFDEAGDVEAAVTHLVLAAEHASRSGSWRSMQRHLERAIALAPADHSDLDRIHLKLSRVAYLIAEHGRADEAARMALRISATRGHVLMQGAAEVAIARVAFAVGRDSDRDAALARGIALLEPLGPSVELADAYTLQLSMAWFERWPNAVEIGRRALALCEQLGWLWGKVRALNTLGLAIFYTGEEPQEQDAIRMLREGLALARTHEFVDITERALTNLYEALVHVGSSAEECHPLRVEAIEHAARYGYSGEEEWQVALEAGEWDRALEIIEDRQSGVSLFAAKRALHAAFMRAFREGPAAGLAAAERPREQLLAARAAQWTNVATLRGVIRSLAGEHEGAIADARLGLGSPPEFYVEDALVAAIIAAHEQGDVDALAALVARARLQLGRARLGLSGDERTAAYPVAFAAFARGIEAERREDRPTALAEHALAAAVAERWGRWYTATQARLRRARLLAATDPMAARGEIDHVLPYWRRAKATWYLAELARTAGSLGAMAMS